MRLPDYIAAKASAPLTSRQGSAPGWRRLRHWRRNRFFAVGVLAAPLIFAGVAPAGGPRHSRLKQLLQPTLVTLQVHNLGIQKILEKLSRQAQVQFAFPTSGAPLTSGSYSLDIRRQPLWKALETIRQKTGYGLINWSMDPLSDAIPIQQGSKQLPLTIVRGPFEFQASSISVMNSFRLAAGKRPPSHIAQTLNLPVVLFMEPKIWVVEGGAIVLDEVLNAKGKPVARRSLHISSGFWSTSLKHIWNNSISIGPAHFGKSLQVIKGHWTGSIATRIGYWTIKNVLKAPPQTRKIGDTTVSFSGVKVINGQYTATINLSNPHGAKILKNAGPPEMIYHESLISAQGTFLPGGCALRDKNKVAYSTNAMGGGPSGNAYSQQLSWYAGGNFGQPVPGKPRTLTIAIPERIRVIRVPFAFHNIPVP